MHTAQGISHKGTKLHIFVGVYMGLSPQLNQQDP